jgi:glycosyltransferase involved in cell wall biosynthesis
MRVAFYAPLKGPDHPVPSGDRQMARAFRDLLASLGHQVETASAFRSHDRAGDPDRQRRLGEVGRRLAARLGDRLCGRPPESRPRLWFTYHLYHKAPDHLGPAVSRRLNIPYVVAEASVARKQAAGPWAPGFAASLEALAAADLVLAMTRVDLEGLARELPAERPRLFPPFLDEAPFAAAVAKRAASRAGLAATGLDPSAPWLLAVAMMRPGSKLHSYRLLAEALGAVADRGWHLLIAGDGEARAEVEALFTPLGDRVRLLDALSAERLPPLYAACDLYVWPAVDEAYGMAPLEAQAAGLPVLAGDEGGVADVVADGVTGRLVPRRNPGAFVAALSGLLDRPEALRRLGAAAQARVRVVHGLAPARVRLAAALDAALASHATRRAAPCASA